MNTEKWRNGYLQGTPKEATLCTTNIARSDRGFDPVLLHEARPDTFTVPMVEYG